MREDDRSALLHELKTPVSVIAGYAELLATRDDEETRTLAAEQILAASRRLSAKVDELFGAPGAAGGRLELLMAQPPADARRRRGRPARVLVVDDDVFVRSLLRLTLSSSDFELAEATDGDIALDLVEAQRPELVLLDWRMPSLSGDEVLPLLKRRHPGLPVIMLTAAGDEREHARLLGADAFLTKPFSPLELLRTIEGFLDDPAANRVA